MPRDSVSAGGLAAGGRRFFAVALVVSALTLAVFLPVVDSAFVLLDDPAYVTENAQVSAGLSSGGFAWAFTSVGYASNWHPLTWLSHMLDVQLFGLNPAGHHATSLLLHLVNAVLLLSVLRRMTGALWPSAFVAALFAVHPLHVESVAWVAERKDVLSTFFGILAVGAYLRHVRWPGVARLLAVLFWLVLGLMAKPMLVTLPFLLLLLDYWPLGRWGGAQVPAGLDPQLSRTSALPVRVLVEKIPLLLASVASGAMTLVAQQGGYFAKVGDAHYAVRLFNAFLAYVRYAGKAVWPADLTIFYPPATPSAWQAASATAAVAVVSGMAVRWAKSHPYVAVGWFWYLGTLVPVIGMVQLGSQAMADRYMYLPLTGLCIAVAWGVSAASRGRRRGRILAFTAAAIVIVGFAVVARLQVVSWHDGESLFRRAASRSSSYMAHKCLGDALYEKGKLAEAAVVYEEALRLNTLDYETHTKLANLLDDLQQSEQALLHYREALRIHPGFAPALADLGWFYERRGMVREAEDACRKALMSDPNFAEAHNNLGSALLKMGRVAEARASLEEAVRLKPAFPLALVNLGLALELAGERGNARRRYAEALRLDPGLALAREGLARIGQGKP